MLDSPFLFRYNDYKMQLMSKNEKRRFKENGKTNY